MRILVIAYDISNLSSSASVNKMLTEGLCNCGNSVAVIASQVRSSANFEESICVKPRVQLPVKIAKLAILASGRDLRYCLWSFHAYREALGKVIKFQPDIIYALGSSGKGYILNLAYRLSKRVDKPLAIHLVDPIPPPRHYEPRALILEDYG